MKKRPSKGDPYPKGRPSRAPLTQALQIANSKFASHPDVLAIGVGLKHSKSFGGYRGRRKVSGEIASGVPCIKFLVARKETRPVPTDKNSADKSADVGSPLPKMIVFTHRGRQRRVLTDVEEVPDLRTEAGPAIFTNAENKGSPALFVHERDNPGAVYLLTAGHVVPAGTQVLCEPVASPGGQSINAQPIGRVVDLFRSPRIDGALLDAAAIATPNGVPAFLRFDPWVNTRGGWTWPMALGRLQQGDVVWFKLRGAFSAARGILDAVWPAGGTFPLQNRGPEMMAGPMAAVRMDDAESRTTGGDSGSLWVDAAERCLTMHQIGGTSGGKRISWGQFTTAIIESFADRLGRPIAVLRL